MISEVSDSMIWAEAVCTGKLLEPETHEARLRTIYGYGEGIVKMGRFCGHVGELPGFNSAMWYLPHRDATIVIIVNRTNPTGEPLADILAKTNMKILLPKDTSW